MVDDVARTVSDFMKGYKDEHADDKENAPKVLIVIDSLGMLLTPTDVDQFEKGEMKGDLGRKPKALTALVRNCVNMFGSWNVGLIATNHTYASQDMFNPDDKISGGQGFIYASSIVIAMKKLKLKEDAKGNKITDVRGIRAACKVMKTRFSKPFESVQVKIPYETGMDPFSGLVELFEKKGILVQSGNRLKYVDSKTQYTNKYRGENKYMVPGYTTSMKSKPLIIETLSKFIRESSVRINSIRLVDELFVFIFNNGKAEALKGYNDDLVMSLAIGLWIRETALRLYDDNMQMTRQAMEKINSNAGVYVVEHQEDLGWDMPVGDKRESLTWLIGKE